MTSSVARFDVRNCFHACCSCQTTPSSHTQNVPRCDESKVKRPEVGLPSIRLRINRFPQFIFIAPSRNQQEVKASPQRCRMTKPRSPATCTSLRKFRASSSISPGTGASSGATLLHLSRNLQLQSPYAELQTCPDAHSPRPHRASLSTPPVPAPARHRHSWPWSIRVQPRPPVALNNRAEPIWHRAA